MVPKKCYVFHKIVAVILLVMFIFVVPGAVFASDDMAEKNVEKSFLYEEHGRQYECVIEKGENHCKGIIYEIVEGDRIYCEDFIITINNNGIYKNGELIANYTIDNSNQEIYPMKLYPEQFTSGKIDFSKETNIAGVAISIYMTISKANPYISIAVSVFTPIATDIWNSHMNTGWYQVRSQIELPPTNVPAEYWGALYRIDYRYTVYKTSEMILANRIGSTIYDTYYAMLE